MHRDSAQPPAAIVVSDDEQPPFAGPQSGFARQQFAIGVNTHPVAGLQVSVVQALPSLQVNGELTHAPPEHTSPVVHAFPSLHAAVLGAYTQPDAGLHESFVHPLESLHVTAVPTHVVDDVQWSPLVQALPSLQVFVGS